MKINNVVRITSSNTSRNVAFARAPKKGYEEQEYKNTIQQALDYLGIQNQALIIHGTSFPAKQGEYDIQSGTPLRADELVEFSKLHGFNSIQLGPNGKLNKGDTSPYTSSVFEKNPLFIDFNKLATKEYGAILSKRDFRKVTELTKTNGYNYDQTNFEQAKANADELINLAYNNFNKKLYSTYTDYSVSCLNDDFAEFKTQNMYWLRDYAVLNMLSIKNGTDYYPYWPQEDQDLIQNYKNGDKKARKAYSDIEQKYHEEIDKYKFTQFLIDKQTKEDNATRSDFTFISDLEVGTSSLDELIFKDVFLSDYKLGCKYGGVMNSPQLWGIGVPDPNKLFNGDGSLGPAGEFIKAKLKNALSGAQSIRIDHAMGLVNPYIYKPSTVMMLEIEDKGKTIEYPDRNSLHAGYMSELHIDKNKNYQKVLSKIVLPTMREMGVDPKKVIWEDLGSDETGLFDKIFRQELHLPGISGMIWTKGTEARNKPNNWAYIGCHDNKPGRKMIYEGDIKGRDNWTADYLSKTLRPDPYKTAEREALRTKIHNNPQEQWKAKLADLLRSTKNIQISFMDFFGINKSYNTPGTSGGENWTLRLNPDFKDTYYRSLERNDWAINMPEILAIATQSKFDEDVSVNKKPYWQEKAKVDPLLDRLNYWTNILKEKEIN